MSNKFINLLILSISVVLFLSSCVQGTPSNSRAKLNAKNGLSAGKGLGKSLGASAVGVDEADASKVLFSQKVELSHLVDPFDGTYKKKLSIPKNFKGNLYLAGLNIAALSNKLISVRINFGVDKQAVTFKATVARAPGIVPKTDIQVLVIDMNSKPFSKMRLGYDLFDYNDYSDPTKEIVTDGRNGDLYCRGLKLEDDPTFVASSNVATCSALTDTCLYSYAKITDSTLYSDQIINSISYRLSSIPTSSQIWTESSGVRSPTATEMSSTVCLPDDSGSATVNQLFNTSVTLGYDLLMFSKYYRGPYRSINDDEWQISGDALYNTSAGLFQVRPLLASNTGYKSLLFPRAGKLSLGQGVSYLGSTSHTGARTQLVSDSLGTSQYVDGCNLRVQNFDPATNEGINSCNVSANIEVFYMQDGKEVSITTDNTIKLQLIRPSITNFEGKEVLTTAFKRCESSTTCGSDECCFNSRCWSKDLVTQCVEQTPVIGNQEIGANCSSDFECSSLCCNQSTGSCSPHNPNGTNPIFCSKTSGQQCVSKEFCQQVAVVTCKIVKAGFKADGTAACSLRCPAVMTYGDCKSGSCYPPAQPAIPAFDPNNCAGAVDP